MPNPKSIRARAPKASSDNVRHLMQKIGGQNTGPEKILRSTLFKDGLRFRKNFKPIQNLKIKVDIAFPKQKLCVFIDGCFWHGCPSHFSTPKTNSAWWNEKINDNKLRDTKQTLMLEKNGWLVLRFWEHEVNKSNVSKICERIAANLKNHIIKHGLFTNDKNG